jgi:hypothetical protein
VEIPAAFVVLPWILLTSAVTGAREPFFAGLPLALGLQAAGVATGAALARLIVRPERLRCEWWNRPATQPPDLRRTSRDTSANSASNASN